MYILVALVVYYTANIGINSRYTKKKLREDINNTGKTILGRLASRPYISLPHYLRHHGRFFAAL
jgi:hypothetical protein